MFVLRDIPVLIGALLLCNRDNVLKIEGLRHVLYCCGHPSIIHQQNKAPCVILSLCLTTEYLQVCDTHSHVVIMRLGFYQ